MERTEMKARAVTRRNTIIRVCRARSGPRAKGSEWREDGRFRGALAESSSSRTPLALHANQKTAGCDQGLTFGRPWTPRLDTRTLRSENRGLRPGAYLRAPL